MSRTQNTIWSSPIERIESVLINPINKKSLEIFLLKQPHFDQRTSRWKIGRSFYSDAQLLEVFTHEGGEIAHSAVDISTVKSSWALLEQLSVETSDNQNESLKRWRTAWKNLVARRWSDIDEQIWKGCKYTKLGDNMVLLAPTGKGKEYKPIGSRPEDVQKWLGSIKAEDGNSMLHWIQTNIVESVIEHCVGNGSMDVTAESVLTSGGIPPCMCISVINYAPSTSSEGEVIGYHLRITKSPTIWTYIQSSFEVLMARPDRYIPELKDVTNNENEETYRFININLTPSKHPTWDSWMETAMATSDERKVFMGWIGSILVAKNKGKQALWLHGHGNDGKSVVSGVLADYFGELAVAINGKSMTNQFGASKIEGKRLVIVGDGKNQKLLASEWAHSLTGGDHFDIERKGRDSYSQKLYAKLLVNSNLAPEIRVDEANMISRLIYIKLRRRPDQELIDAGLSKRLKDGSVVFLGNADFPDQLKEEVEGFLMSCVDIYYKLSPTHAQIIQPSWMNDRVISVCSDPRSEAIISFCEDNFEQGDDDEYVSVKDFTNRLAMNISEYGLNDKNGFVISEVYTTLNNLFGAVRKQTKLGGMRQRVISNIKLKKLEDESNTYHKEIDLMGDNLQGALL